MIKGAVPWLDAQAKTDSTGQWDYLETVARDRRSGGQGSETTRPATNRPHHDEWIIIAPPGTTARTTPPPAGRAWLPGGGGGGGRREGGRQVFSPGGDRDASSSSHSLLSLCGKRSSPRISHQPSSSIQGR